MSAADDNLDLQFPSGYATQDPSGYATHDEYFATQLTQGGRIVYSIDLSIPQLVSTVPRPDPEVTLEGNRKIIPSHAKKFAGYVREQLAYVCPALLVRAPNGEFVFNSSRSVPGGSTLGILGVPRLARHGIRIIDGQHRILGFHILWETIDNDLQKARQHHAVASRDGDELMTKDWERNLKKYEKERNRLAKERVRIDIVIVDDPQDFKQVFVDIAENQKGISGAVKAKFDSRKVVHRALDDVLRHPLLVGRVDEQSDRSSKNSPYLLGAKHVADIIRAIQVGTAGRISWRQESELESATVAREASNFFDLLVDSFVNLEAVMDKTIDPAELRRKSVLGSATMLRTLAGVHHALTSSAGSEDMWTRDEVKSFFGLLEPHLGAPVEADGILMLTGAFLEGNSAPNARMGDLTKLQTQLVAWARDGLPVVLPPSGAEHIQS